ncbi:uncharacterized protein [Henckelia pumila]
MTDSSRNYFAHPQLSPVCEEFESQEQGSRSLHLCCFDDFQNAVTFDPIVRFRFKKMFWNPCDEDFDSIRATSSINSRGRIVNRGSLLEFRFEEFRTEEIRRWGRS